MEKWKSSGPNTQRMMKEDPLLWEKIENVTISIKPTSSGGVRMEPFGIPEESQGLSNADSLLYGFFLMLIMNPLWERLGGPCARCDDYYVKNTKRQKVYCSKRCGPIDTSVNCNRKRRRAQHLEKLEIARRFIAKWQASGSKKDWKRWVSQRSAISTNWLTRALNAQELTEPTRQDSARSAVS